MPLLRISKRLSFSSSQSVLEGETRISEHLQGDHPPVVLGLGNSAILPELAELSQQEVLTDQMGHPVLLR